MPSVSAAQDRFMRFAASAKGRAKLKAEGKRAPSAAVAKEFVSADAGRKIGKLPQHVKKAK